MCSYVENKENALFWIIQPVVQNLIYFKLVEPGLLHSPAQIILFGLFVFA